MPTKTPHEVLLELIQAYAGDDSLSFDEKGRDLLRFVEALDDAELIDLLSEAGFIPESYGHDSSEEKVYAKAMDIAVATALGRLGYEPSVSPERSNAADVQATGGSDSHVVVLDAKAFRLSRTALNPKDYKIEALNNWRRGADYACLIGPLAGFPEGNSRLFAEGIRFNVTLFTFSHLQFALEHGVQDEDSLEAVWKASPAIEAAVGKEPNATQYWAELDRTFCEALGKDIKEWAGARRRYFEGMVATADKQIRFFEAERQQIEALPREELVRVALEAMKIEGKIAVITAKKKRTHSLLQAVEDTEI